MTLKAWLDLAHVKVFSLQGMEAFIYVFYVSCNGTSGLSYLQIYSAVVLLSCHAATDWQFASTREGHRVPFATAVDCYSAARCPQVGTTVCVCEE